MVGGRCSAAWAVVEDGEVCQLPCQFHHVFQPSLDALWRMVQVGDGEVAREDGKRIHQYLVVSAEGYSFLLGRKVGRAEETLAFLDGLGIYFGTRGDNAGGVELYFVAYAAYIQFSDLYACQCSIVVSCRFPVSKLFG